MTMTQASRSEYLSTFADRHGHDHEVWAASPAHLASILVADGYDVAGRVYLYAPCKNGCDEEYEDGCDCARRVDWADTGSDWCWV